MSQLLAKIDSDLREALKNRDEIRVSVLRLIKASAKNRSIDKQSPLSDEDVHSVLSTQIKQRKESLEHYLKAGREDLATREKREIEIISSYLPKQLTPDEIDNIIKDAIHQSQATSVTDIGKVMKIVMPIIKGKADGKYVNERVKAFLGK